MPEETIHIRPAPIEGPRPRVVPLHNGTLLPAEGKRVVKDHHVRMLLKHGDVVEFTPEPEAEPTKNQRRVRGEETSA